VTLGAAKIVTPPGRAARPAEGIRDIGLPGKFIHCRRKLGAERQKAIEKAEKY